MSTIRQVLFFVWFLFVYYFVVVVVDYHQVWLFGGD